MHEKEGTTYDGEAEDKRPEASHGVRLGRFPQAFLMLAVLAFEGIGHELFVGQDLRLLNVVLLKLFDISLRAMLRCPLWLG